MDINLEYYKIFYYTAKQKSVTLAAEKLSISQPAVSQAIKHLEKDLGCALFVRMAKGVRLTKEGEMLFSYVERGYEAMHTQLSRLFTQNRTLSLVYDFGVLEWFIRFYAEQAKKYRGKADLVLRTLMKLPYMNVKPDSREFSVLTKAGYRCDEIILANSLAVWADRLPDRLSSKSITAEKIAAACGRMLLNAPKDLSEEFYEYLGWLFRFYDSFTVKYEHCYG